MWDILYRGYVSTDQMATYGMIEKVIPSNVAMFLWALARVCLLTTVITCIALGNVASPAKVLYFKSTGSIPGAYAGAQCMP